MRRALIVDDERLARITLRAFLSDAGWTGEIQEAADGPSALRALEEFRPDILFLDVEMPGMTGLEVLRRGVRPPLVVFTTAYDQYAMTAFDLEAFGYLVKPFGPDRVARVLERADVVLAQRDAASNTSNWLEHIFARHGTATLRIAVADVERFQGHDDHVAVFVQGRRILADYRLRDLARRLDPASFVQIHRSHIINMRFLAGFRSVDPNRARVTLTNGTSLMASRAGTARLRQLRKEPTSRDA